MESIINTVGQGDYQIARYGYFSDFNDLGSLFDLWVIGSPNNYFQHACTEYDELIFCLFKPHAKGMHLSPLGWEFYRNAYIEQK